MAESHTSQCGTSVSGANKRKVSDSPGGRQEFAEVWTKDTGDWMYAIHLTATRMYIGGDDDEIGVYYTATRQQIKEISHGGGYMLNISQSRDGNCLFVAHRDGTAGIVNLPTGVCVILRGHTAGVACIIQGEGTDVLTCSWDKTIRRWNSSTGECLKIYEGHTEWVLSILYDEATKRIFSASGDDIIIWNSETGDKIGVMYGHCDFVNSLAQANGTTIASVSDDGTIKLWNTATLACIKTILNDSAMYSVSATPDGQFLITGSSDNKVNVWSVATGQCVHTLSRHKDWVYRVAVSPDGRFIASSGGDCIFLFSVSPPFAFVIREGVLVHGDREESLALLSDGAIRGSNGDLITTITDTTTCYLTSDKQIFVNCSGGSIEFVALSAEAAQLWSEAIGAVAADLALHSDDRAHSADQMIRRYRFNLLQTILVHRRERGTRKWHIPREIVQTIGGYVIRG